jgi:hypothetical protein
MRPWWPPSSAALSRSKPGLPRTLPTFPAADRVLITEPQGFERTVAFALDEAAATITQRVPETIED